MQYLTNFIKHKWCRSLMTTLSYNLPCLHKEASECLAFTQQVQFQGHTGWPGKGSIYSGWGPLMERASSRGRWMVPPTWASQSSQFHSLHLVLDLGGHFLRRVHSNLPSLSMTTTKWHLPPPPPPPQPGTESGGVGMMSRGILPRMCRPWSLSLFLHVWCRMVDSPCLW